MGEGVYGAALGSLNAMQGLISSANYLALLFAVHLLRVTGAALDYPQCNCKQN